MVRTRKATPQNKVEAPQQEAVELFIYGEIMEDGWWDNVVSANAVAEALANIPAEQPINLRINSPGGAVSEGLAIYNQLKRRSNVTAYIDGYACSAASFVALAADKVISPKSSIWMVHPVSGLAWGTAETMRQMADSLDTHDEAVRHIYVDRTGMSDEEIKEMLDAETWFTGQEAYEMGFATAVTDDPIQVEQRLPDRFRMSASRAKDKLEPLGWHFGKDSRRGNVTAIVRQPAAMSAAIVDREENSNIQEEPVTMTDKDKPTPVTSESDRITQMSDQIRDLKLQLTTATTARQEAESTVARQKIINQYWQLRATGLNLFAVENKLTEEDFRLDFSEDPAIDIDNLTSMSADDARFDLGMKDRMLRRCAAKSPMERVTNEADKAKLENSTLKSRAADTTPGQRETASNVQPQSSPTGEKSKDYAQKLVDRMFK